MKSAIDRKQVVDIKSAKLAELVAEYAIIVDTVQKLTDPKLADSMLTHPNSIPDDGAPEVPGPQDTPDAGGSKGAGSQSQLKILQESQSKILELAVKKRNESLPHVVSRSGVCETDPFGNAARAFDAFQNIFRESEDLLPSAVRKAAKAIGNTKAGSSHKSISEMSDFMQDVINSMKEGESISLGKHKTRGFNTEVFRLVIPATLAVITGGSVVAWAIPIVDLGYQRDFKLYMLKTKDGISVEILNSRANYKQLGARSGVGVVGLSDKGAAGKGWGFAGFELAGKGKHTDKEDDSIKFTIKDEGNGNIEQTVRDILSGKADLFRLMKQSEETVSSHKQGTEKNLSLGGVLVGAAGTEHPGYGPWQGSPGAVWQGARRCRTRGYCHLGKQEYKWLFDKQFRESHPRARKTGMGAQRCQS